MFARMSVFRGDVGRLAEGVAMFREKILPETESQPGFAGALLLADREGEAAYSLTFWETEEARDARKERGRELAEMAARELGMELTVHELEVPFARFPALTH